MNKAQNKKNYILKQNFLVTVKHAENVTRSFTVDSLFYPVLNSAIQPFCIKSREIMIKNAEFLIKVLFCLHLSKKIVRFENQGDVFFAIECGYYQ